MNPLNGSCKAYDLSEIDFFQDKKGNLGDYVFSEVYHELDSMSSSEKYTRDEEGSKTLRYTQKAKELIESSEILNTYVYQMGGESIYALDEKPYDSFERVYIDLQVNREILSDADKNAYDFILAIMNLFVHQGLDDMFRSYSVQSIDFELHAQENAFHELIQDLKAGILPITSGLGHAINAVALYRDIDNPGEYILEVYDNNNHKNTKEIRYEKQKLSRFVLDATAWMNEYRYEAYDMEGIFWNAGDSITLNFSVLEK